MKTHVLITASIDWADEFSCTMFAVGTRQDWEDQCARAKAYFAAHPGEEVECGFGTNESLTFSSYEDWFRSAQVKEITEEEAALIVRLFDLKVASWDHKDKRLMDFGTGASYFDLGLVDPDYEEA